ncbi:unnamed protein product [Lymnaea stagnalis]|uniref:Uncharacterized protein n=1 Tax=Lymnaea stagnalis TaxID=6523 RepID=A0AAV2HT45_LYMST
MADEFKTYDKSPILEFITLKRWSFGLRETILAAIAVLLLVLCVIFAGLLGKAKDDLSEVSSASHAAFIENKFCTDIGCMETATRAMELRNKSVDPCEDFYEYACGNYNAVRTFYPNGVARNVLRDLSQENQDRLIDLMEQPISQMHDFAAERKLKQFFQACNDLYTREKKRGLPFLTQVVPELGGWKVLGNWQSSWDLNTALKKVQGQFWVDAFYSPTVVGTDWYDQTKKVIHLAPAGTGKWMYWSWYTNPNTQKYRDDYKKFIRRVGALLARDAVSMKVAPPDNGTLEMALDEFVNDTYTIEYNLAVIAAGSDYQDDPYLDSNKVTLTQLNTDTGNVIDWVQQLTYLFNTARVTGSTKVVLSHVDYFRNVTNMISSLPASDRNRMLHNYLIWRVAETYVQELSWEYIHANREMYDDMYNRQDFSGVYKYCMATAKYYMGDALSSLYVNRHFSQESKDTVSQQTVVCVRGLCSDPGHFGRHLWLDSSEGFSSTIICMLHPHHQVDQIYNGLTVNITDHFGNLLSANQYKRDLWSEELAKVGEDREEWQYPTYSTFMSLYWFWNEIAAPAGILQFPIYSKKQPHYSTFGSLGSILGRFLHHVVDEWGKWFDKNGNLLEEHATWWSNGSLMAYEPVRKCVYDIYDNITKTYVFPDGVSRTVKVNAARQTPSAIARTNGVRLALIAYNDWMKNLAQTEKMLPGLGLTNEQMVFLAHAQTFCYDKNDRWTLNRMLRGTLSDDTRINMALGQLPEFSRAFKCKPGAKMNHEVKCDYY